RDAGASGVRVDVENLLPCLPAVSGLEDAPLFVRVPRVAGRADVDGVARLRTDGDPRDVLGVFESRRAPRRAGVARFADAGADGYAVAHPRLAGADPDVLVVRRIDRDRADRLRRLVVKNRLEREAGIGRLPDAAARRADVDRRRRVGGAVDRRNAAAHDRRTDRARAKTAERR